MNEVQRSLKEHPFYHVPTVNTWRSRIKDNTFTAHFYVFRRFMEWLSENGGDLSGFTPDQLVAYQKKAVGDDRYKIVDLVEAWVLTLRGRVKGKERYLASIKSFFLHNRAELPRDPSFKIRADEPPVQSTLIVEDVRKVVLKSSPLYRAVFLCMMSGGMGEAEIVAWSNTSLASLKSQLEADAHTIKVMLPGRKLMRNKRPYYTLLGRDACEALKNYMKYRPQAKTTAIFVNQKGTPLKEKIIAQYWLRALKRLGLVTEGQGKNIRYGKNPHELRDTFRTRWHKSGADGLVAEFFMGHEVDPLGYNKAMNDEDYTKKEYLKAEKWLNILSEDPTKISVNEVEELKRKLDESEKVRDAEVQRVKTEMAEMRQMMEDMKTIYGLNRIDSTQPKQIDFLIKNDGKVSFCAKNYETGSEARSEVEKILELMKQQGVETETLFENTTNPAS